MIAVITSKTRDYEINTTNVHVTCGKTCVYTLHYTTSQVEYYMEHLKRVVKIGDTVVFNLRFIFLRFLVISQWHEMELLPIFGLYAVPPSLMDEYGCLRRGNKAILVHKLGVKHHKPPRSNVIIVYSQQLLYNVVCKVWMSYRGKPCLH